jgi:hypothetical protein
MAFPSKPEPAKNGWINRSIERFKAWAYSRQPIPNQQDFDVTEGVDGVRFSIKKKLLPPEPKREHREFHIEAAGSKKLRVFNGTLFGRLPTGFSANDDPVFEITARYDGSPLQSGDKIYARVTWDRTLNITGNIASTITTRTIQASSSVPADDPQAGVRRYELATITLPASNVPIVSQTRWGPIDDLPGTALYNYYMNSSSTSPQTDYWDLLATGKGKQAGGVTDLAPTYDSVQVAGYGGWARFITSGTNLKIMARGTTMNSVGQITYIGPEYTVFDKPVVCETTLDVLVGLRLNGGYLEGQYRTIKVNTVTTPSPEWVSTGIPVTAGTTIQCV